MSGRPEIIGYDREGAAAWARLVYGVILGGLLLVALIVYVIVRG